MNAISRAALTAALIFTAAASGFGQAATGASVKPSGASAQPTTAAAVASARPVGLDAVRAMVLATSAAYAKAELALKTAELGKLAQAYDGGPSLSAAASGSLGYGEGASLGDSVSATVKLSASQTLFDGGRQAALLRSESLAVEAAKESLSAMKSELVGQADAAFYAVLKADASALAAADDLAAARIRLDLAKAKAEAGVIARSDYLQAESEAASYGTALIKANKTRAAARAKLASLSGLAASAELAPAEPAEGLLSRLASIDEAGSARLAAAAVAAATAGNPSLAEYSIAAEQASQAVKAAKSAYLPSVDAGLSHAATWDASRGLELGAGSVSLSASLSLDFWATRTAVDKASVAASSAGLAEAEAARTLALDVEVAVGELLGAARAVESSAKALAYAESNYDGVLERYRLSSASASELSSALALVSAARTSLISARYDFLGYFSELRGLCGLDGDAELLALFP